MNQISRYHRPRSLAEALGILRDEGGRAAILAGGTSLSVRLPPRVEALIDIQDLGLDTIEVKKDELYIGAGVRLRQLVDHEDLAQLFGGVLGKAASRIASTPLRNLITVGGNLVQILPWSDLPGVMLALDASVVTRDAAGRSREIHADTFFARHPRTQLSPAEMVTGVRIPIPRYVHLGSFKKVSRTAVDYATLSVTVSLHMEQNTILSARVAMGALAPLPIRAKQAEAILINQRPERALFVKAGAMAAGATKPSRDYRYPVTYRKHLVKIWVRRCLEEAAQMARGGQHAD